jgi:signal peptidase I
MDYVRHKPNNAVARQSFARRVKDLLVSWGPVLLMVGLIRGAVAESFMVSSGSMRETIKVGDCMLVNKFAYGIRAPFTGTKLIPVGAPQRKDIVVFKSPTEPESPEPKADHVRIFPRQLPLLPLFWNKAKSRFVWYAPRTLVKRCVAIAGDTVEVRNKRLFVNGKSVDDARIAHNDPRLIPAGAGQHRTDATSFQQRWEQRGFYSDFSVRDNFGPVIVPAGHVMAMGDNRDNSWDSRFWGPLDVRNIKGKPLVMYFSYEFPDEAYTNGPESELRNPSILTMLLRPWGIRPSRIGHLLS